MTAPISPKPAKPKGCPLFPHAGGTWAKTIDGKHKHFGPWNDLEGAMKRWEAFNLARRAGVQARPVADGSILLKQIANRFLTFHHGRARSGELELRSFRDMKHSVEHFVEAIGGHIPIAALHPGNFTAYRAKLVDRLGYHALKRRVTIIRQMFRWAFDNDLIEHPVKFGSGFATEKKERAAVRRARLDLSFSVDEICKMIDAADGPMKAMILLAINLGFGNTDIGSLEWADIKLDAGLLDTFRHKTGVRRRGFLWPETVAALKEVEQTRRRAIDPADEGIVFLNRNGRRYVRETTVEKDGVIVGVSVVDNIPQEFARLMGAIGIYTPAKANKHKFISDGRGFYCIRRTHRTWSDEVKDKGAADMVMGHADESMAAVYIQGISDERLKAVTDHIHSKLFTSKTQSPRQYKQTSAGASRGKK